MNASTALTMTPMVEFRIPFVFMLFSMDVFLPYCDLIGADFKQPRKVMEVLRREIVSTRQRFARDANPERYDAQATLAALAREASEHDARLLVWWTTHLLDSPHARALLGWQEVLQHCDKEDALWQGLGLPEAERAVVRRMFAQSTDATALRQRQSSLQAPTLSDWDLHIYAVCLFEDHDPANQRPSLFVYQAYRWYAAHRFWGYLVDSLSDETLTRFRDNADRIASEVPHLKDDVPLARPRELSIGVAQ